MFAKLLDLLKQDNEPSPVNREEREQLATCVLVLEVAKADGEFSLPEYERVVASLCARFSLNSEQVEELIRVSKDVRKHAVDLFQFTNYLNRVCAPEEKMRLMEEVWSVIYADRSVDAHEEYVARKLAGLLHLNHPQFIEAKLKALTEMRDSQAE